MNILTRSSQTTVKRRGIKLQRSTLSVTLAPSFTVSPTFQRGYSQKAAPQNSYVSIYLCVRLFFLISILGWNRGPTPNEKWQPHWGELWRVTVTSDATFPAARFERALVLMSRLYFWRHLQLHSKINPSVFIPLFWMKVDSKTVSVGTKSVSAEPLWRSSQDDVCHPFVGKHTTYKYSTCQFEGVLIF